MRMNSSVPERKFQQVLEFLHFDKNNRQQTALKYFSNKQSDSEIRVKFVMMKEQKFLYVKYSSLLLLQLDSEWKPVDGS